MAPQSRLGLARCRDATPGVANANLAMALPPMRQPAAEGAAKAQPRPNPNPHPNPRGPMASAAALITTGYMLRCSPNSRDCRPTVLVSCLASVYLARVQVRVGDRVRGRGRGGDWGWG